MDSQAAPSDYLTDLDHEIVRQEDGPSKWPSGAARGVGKVSYTHDAMIDFLIADPTISQNALAAKFGYTPAWVSQIISSDAFQAKLAERREEIVDPTIRATVEDNFKALIIRSQAVLLEKLNKPAEQIPDNLALRAGELATRAMGYGARETTVAVQVNMDNHLEKLGDNLVKLLQRRKQDAQVFDHEDPV